MKYRFLRFISIAACTLAYALGTAAPAHAQPSTMVRLHTTQGPIDIKLLDTQAPITVANFLAYVRGGDYTNAVIHRSAWLPGTTPIPFVVQGGLRWLPDASTCCTPVPSRGAIQNEFSPTRSNVRGTVAMAKVGNDPNSATSQWFVNMRDNAANLDNQNGGFTVFGRVTASGLVVADQISLLTRLNIPAWGVNEFPVSNWQSGFPTRSQAVLLTAATEFPAVQSDNDRIFNYIEATYPTYLMTAPTSVGVYDGYNYRYYDRYGVSLVIKNGRVAYYAPSVDPNPVDIGAAANWIAIAVGEGY